MKFFYALGELTSDLVESIGTAIRRLSSEIILAGQLVNTKKGAMISFYVYIGLIVQCSTILISFVVKGIFSIFGDAFTSVYNLVMSIVRCDFRIFVKAVMLPLHSLNGHILVFSGFLVVVVQKLFFIQKSDRSFTDDESDVLKDLFDDSIAMYNVRVVAGKSGVFHVNGRPFVLGNFIFMKNWSIQKNLPVLIHECVHIWQYQRYGARYASEALYAQWTLPNAYDWRTEKKRDSNWFNWNREAQASFIEEMWGKYKFDGELKDGNTLWETTGEESDENFTFYQGIIAKIKLGTSNRIV
jgi:hypothetical protein